MKEEFNKINWENLLDNKTVCEKWEIFMAHYKQIIQSSVPYYTKTKGTTKPKWMTTRLQTLIRQKDEAWQKYRTRRNAALREQYTRKRNIVTREVRAAKWNYEKRVALDSVENVKHFWAYVRSKTGGREKLTTLKDEAGKFTENDRETAQVMNRAFNAVFVREDVTHPIPSPEHMLRSLTYC